MSHPSIAVATIGVLLSALPSVAQQRMSFPPSSPSADRENGNGNGGYRIGQYGYGRYVGGPNGGFGGYPAGSSGAQVLKQTQQWKCRDVPERC